MNQNNKPKYQSLQVGDTIGILGGGQLGRMLAIAASRLGLKTIVLEPGADCPASQTCNRHIVAAYDDKQGLEDLAANCKAVTYEFENIPHSAVKFLEDKIQLLPNAQALDKSQDRLVEKNFLNSIGISTAPFAEVNSLDDLIKAAEMGDGILKTRRFGYDGKGQARIRSGDDQQKLTQAWQSVAEASSVLESFVDFTCEISIIAARSISGDIACFDPAENIHRDGILFTSTIPANVSEATINSAKQIAAKILEELDYVGVIGVEFFFLSNGSLLVNEIAPRVHNSGHWTEAACAVSQFEQHIRAIAGWPLGSTAHHSNCIMQNLIGEEVNEFANILSQPDVHVHLYGKKETKPGRKMGHFTRLIR